MRVRDPRRHLRPARCGRRRRHVLDETARHPTKWERKGARLREAAPGTGRSEKLAHLAHVSWRRKHGHHVNEWDREAVELLPPEDRAQLARSLERLDGLADGWHALGVGGSLTVRWPWPEGRLPSTGGTRRKRSPGRRRTASGRAP